MDISLAPYNSDDWQVLAFAPDEYVYNQDHQQNYTAFVVSWQKYAPISFKQIQNFCKRYTFGS